MPWPDHDRLRFHCDPARPAVDRPTPLGHHRWEFPILPDDDERRLTSDDAVYDLVSRYGIGRDNVKVLRVDERHHSVAIAGVRGLPVDPVRTRVQHLNIQAAGLDNLARSCQRGCEPGFDMALSVGQHTNDKELSYYARSPSGFEWEAGWNPVVVDEATWEPGTHQGISIWGRTPVGRTIVDKLEQFRLGARSLVRSENTVPALSGAGIADG